MNWEEIKKWLTENAGTAEVLEFLKTLQGGGEITPDKVEEFLKSTHGQPIKDRLNTQFLEAYRENGLKKELAKHDETWQARLKEELDKQRKTLKPEETPEQKLLRELQENQKALESQLKRKDLEVNTSKKLAEHGLPAAFLNYLLAGSPEEVDQNIETFKNVFSTSIQAEVEKRFQEAGGNRPAKATTLKVGEFYTLDQIKSMTPAEVAANHDKVMESYARLNKK